jgi:hypothetical protein
MPHGTTDVELLHKSTTLCTSKVLGTMQNMLTMPQPYTVGRLLVLLGLVLLVLVLVLDLVAKERQRRKHNQGQFRRMRWAVRSMPPLLSLSVVVQLMLATVRTR